VALRDTGIVATFTANYVKDETTGEMRFFPVIAIRQDGADTTFLTQLNPAILFEDVYVGMPVKIKWKDQPEGNLGDIEYYDAVEDVTKKMKLQNE
jgi:uncharacterized OB-fold protein